MSKKLVGSAKESERGLTVELNITKLLAFLEDADVQAAIKRFQGGAGQQNECLLLFVDPLPMDKVSKFCTHSLSINTNYRQKG